MNDIRSILRQRKSVIWALINKEMAVKLGNSYLGHIWIIIEPLMYVGFFYLIFFYISKSSISGLNIITFISTGVFPFFYFRKTVQGLSTVVDANQKLLFYQMVTIFDAIIARFILETVISSCVLIILFIIIIFVDNTTIYYPMRIVYSILALIMITLGASMFLAIICYYFSDISKFMGFTFRIFIIVSAVFFNLTQLPMHLAYYISFNPLAQIIENFRSAFIINYYHQYISNEYMMTFCFIVLFCGIGIYFILRKNILTKAKGR